MTVRQVEQGQLPQGLDEIISYKVDTTPWGGPPTSPVLKVWRHDNGAWVDVTATVAPSGAPTVDGNIITFQPIKLLEDDFVYRAIFQWIYSGNTLSAFLDILAEK